MGVPDPSLVVALWYRSTRSNCFHFAIYSSCSGICNAERGLDLGRIQLSIYTTYMCLCLCFYLFVCVCLHVCVCACMRSCVRVCSCVCVYAFVRACMRS